MEEYVIERNHYLNQLISKRGNRLIKIITGVRRCGKSFLLFNLYKEYLLNDGVDDSRIITLALDNIFNAVYRDPMVLSEYLNDRISDKTKMYYIFLDEIQYVQKKKISNNPEITVTFYDVLNALQQRGSVDIYVTGSNSKMLSKDIATEFRGRGDELYITPFSYKELYDYYGGDKGELFRKYMTYGGMPMTLFQKTDADKKQYLSGLFRETYLKDIGDRHKIAYPEALDLIATELSSSVGSLTNSSKLANTLKTAKGTGIDSETVGAYLGYITESYLFSKADRYDVKGRRYFSYPSKYYCVDPGLRNVKLNFRQIEETHLMENIIYNELRSRGYAVDVGVVESQELIDGKRHRITREIDFVINAENPGERYYIQSALTTEDPEKMEQEIRPFLKLKNDFTKRIIITKSDTYPWTDNYGIHHISLYNFLLGDSM